MRRLAAILALVLGLTLLAAPPASAAVAASAENRASGSATAPDNRIGIETRLSEEAVREKVGLDYDLASDDAVAAKSGLGRVRHHTSPEALASIQRQGVINPSRAGGVHVETQPFGPARTASQETGAFGRGAYVEFDAPSGIVPTHVGPRSTGVIPTGNPLPLQGTNASFVTRPWWKFWGD